jgi:hypothetical protein
VPATVPVHSDRDAGRFLLIFAAVTLVFVVCGVAIAYRTIDWSLRAEQGDAAGIIGGSTITPVPCGPGIIRG